MPSALVTGSAKGIGRALALALAELGYDIAFHYLRSKEEAERAAEVAATHGVDVKIFQADVTMVKEAQVLVQRTADAFGGLDVLINNVGNYDKTPLVDVTPKIWHDMIASNLNSTFYTCQTAIPIMREAGFGRIINIGFAGAEHVTARPAISPYHIAKTGVILYSKDLAKANAAYGITVNVISPGVLENSESIPDNLPMERPGSLEEFVAAARFLLSDEARYVTGITLEVSGGWNL